MNRRDKVNQKYIEDAGGVNEATARLFYDQCLGSNIGHMAEIPYTQEQFAGFLREVADWLDGGGA